MNAIYLVRTFPLAEREGVLAGREVLGEIEPAGRIVPEERTEVADERVVVEAGLTAVLDERDGDAVEAEWTVDEVRIGVVLVVTEVRVGCVRTVALLRISVLREGVATRWVVLCGRVATAAGRLSVAAVRTAVARVAVAALRTLELLYVALRVGCRLPRLVAAAETFTRVAALLLIAGREVTASRVAVRRVCSKARALVILRETLRVANERSG